jgi:hypothetical protein
MLNKIEKDECEANKLIIDILLERLGRCPDELECMISQKEYDKMAERNRMEQAITDREFETAGELLLQYKKNSKKESIKAKF